MRTHTMHFVRHYLEMLAAMVVGMVVLGMLVRLLVAAGGVGYPSELAALEMAFDMSVGMVVWMRYRRHSWPATLEMVAWMVAPFLVLAPMSWAGVISDNVLMLVSHAAMLPLMLLAMLRRHAEYVR